VSNKLQILLALKLCPDVSFYKFSKNAATFSRLKPVDRLTIENSGVLKHKN